MFRIVFEVPLNIEAVGKQCVIVDQRDLNGVFECIDL